MSEFSVRLRRPTGGRSGGPTDFSLAGIVAGLSGALAAASIGIFVVSTYNTDYLSCASPTWIAPSSRCAMGHTVAIGAWATTRTMS